MILPKEGTLSTIDFLPRVSVIVPVYNAERTLEPCILSLLKVNYPKERLEFIFVDNASTDGTAAILQRYRDDIHILYEARRGPAAARNRGILNAKGDVVAFTDSDCVVDADWLRHIVSPLQDHRVGAIGGAILSKQPCNEIERFGEEIHDHRKAITVYRPPYVITMNWLSRLSVLKQVDLFDEGLTRCSDVDLSFRLLQSGYTFIFQPEAIVYHRNERTLWGVFKEGLTHGYHSLPVLRKHRLFLKHSGHRRFNRRRYVIILSSLIHSLRRQDPQQSRCRFTFESGKVIGKVFGSIKFFYLDL